MEVRIRTVSRLWPATCGQRYAQIYSNSMLGQCETQKNKSKPASLLHKSRPCSTARALELSSRATCRFTINGSAIQGFSTWVEICRMPDRRMLVFSEGPTTFHWSKWLRAQFLRATDADSRCCFVSSNQDLKQNLNSCSKGHQVLTSACKCSGLHLIRKINAYQAGSFQLSLPTIHRCFALLRVPAKKRVRTCRIERQLTWPTQNNVLNIDQHCNICFLNYFEILNLY